MSIQNRINELSNKHRDLDTKIQYAQKRPAINSLKLTELKREKLRLKEKISDLQR
jgi:hypothetical protein